MTDNVAQLEGRQPRQHDQELIATVQQVMESDELSQAAIASQSGINKSRLNQWLKGVYKGDVPAVESDIRRWLDSRETATRVVGQLPAAPDWVETPSARAVLSALSFSQMAEAISVIYGGAGVGKTSTITRYADQAPNVWVVTASPSTAAPGPILSRIAQKLGIRTGGALHLVEAAIIERVSATRGLLVIDESQHLTPRALDAVRSIHDAAGIGIALVGNEIVYTQLTGGNRSVGFAQLFSRVAKRVRLTRARDGDVAALLDAWQVKDKASRQLCLEIGRRPGALRGLSQTLRLATMFAASTGGGALQASHIRDAWRDLGGDA